MNTLNDLYIASLRGLSSEVHRRRAGIIASMRALADQDSDFAKIHRRSIVAYDEVLAVIEKRLAEAKPIICSSCGRIGPPPPPPALSCCPERLTVPLDTDAGRITIARFLPYHRDDEEWLNLVAPRPQS